MTTLTYVYADQTAVVGPLATYAEPHAYDLCEQHSERLSAPRGWEVLRLASDQNSRGPSGDDLLALADAVREAARERPPTETAETGVMAQPGGSRSAPRSAPSINPHGYARETGRRGHLRILATDPYDDE